MSISLSRYALDQFIKCPLCFYTQRKLGLKPPAMIPLTLALATDALLKNEFDAVRASGASHPLWKQYGINVAAFQHTELDLWRNNKKGIRVRHESTGAEIFGSVDDVWLNLDTEELHVVDYKSTSKKEAPSLDGKFGAGYKRQMDVYQWLFRQSGFKVSSVGYFLYINGIKQKKFYENGLDGVMHFDTTLIPYESTDSWVEKTISDAVSCINSSAIPNSGEDCDNCRYFVDRTRIVEA